MNVKSLLKIAGLWLLLSALATHADATPAEAQQSANIGKTWTNQNSLLITDALAKSRTGKATKASAAKVAALKFKPAGDSGVASSLANALGRNAGEKAALKQAFAQIKQGYESEVAKRGKSHHLAAAMTFFIAANVMAYHQTEEPSEPATENLFRALEKAMSGLPEFTRMPNPEKQKLHDWLVIMAGFVMTGYADARQQNDAAGLMNFRELSEYSLRLVLGVEPENLSFSTTELDIESTPPSSETDSSNRADQVVGVWSKSASSPGGFSPGAILTNVGYYKGRYLFSANGTYNFKGESWGGHLRSQEFWTIEENGSYAVKGDALTISPKTSKSTLRNGAGAVQKSQSNPLEKATYKWKLHYFEGIGEMNLVLQPAKPTTRDGGFSGNSNFPNSYLYGRNSNLEWKY